MTNWDWLATVAPDYIARYEWSRHCGQCQKAWLGYLYEWRNMVYGNRYAALTEVWR